MEGQESWSSPQARYQMAPSYASSSDTQIRQPHTDTLQSFTLFSRLPKEIQCIIWRAALTPRIIKWTRIDGRHNSFTVPSRTFPLYYVSREARDAVMLYGEYRDISNDSTPLYFSPHIDYLFFDAYWRALVLDPNNPTYLTPDAVAARNVDPLDAILPDFAEVRKVIVHPNFTDTRATPRTLFGKLLKLEQLLIGVDEKSLGDQINTPILGSVYDAKMYYESRVKKKDPQAKIPHIVVGVLGWRGEERMRFHHGAEDKRQLVGIYEKQHELALHLRGVREEERQFLENSFRMRPPQLKLKLKLRPGQTMDGFKNAVPVRYTDRGLDARGPLPTYSSIDERMETDVIPQLENAAIASDQVDDRVGTRPDA